MPKLTGPTPLLQVFDMIAALDFYRDRLGFSVVGCSPEVETPEGRFSHWVWLRRDDSDLMLNTAFDSGERPPRPDSTRSAVHADTGLFFGCDNIDALYRELVDRGLRAEPPRTVDYGMRQLSLLDPDGYELCFQHPA